MVLGNSYEASGKFLRVIGKNLPLKWLLFVLLNLSNTVLFKNKGFEIIKCSRLPHFQPF